MGLLLPFLLKRPLLKRPLCWTTSGVVCPQVGILKWPLRSFVPSECQNSELSRFINCSEILRRNPAEDWTEMKCNDRDLWALAPENPAPDVNWNSAERVESMLSQRTGMFKNARIDRNDLDLCRPSTSTSTSNPTQPRPLGWFVDRCGQTTPEVVFIVW